MSRNIFNPKTIDQGFIDGLVHEYEDRGGLTEAFRVHADLKPNPTTSTYISDNGNDPDAAIGEIRLNLADLDRAITTISGRAAPRAEYFDVPAQDWRAAAFDLAQFSRYRMTGPGNSMFVNCAPRLDQRGVKKGSNAGENVYIGMLPNGTVVSGVSGHSFAFFRDLVEEGDMEIYKVNVQTNGSQFRSRDFFPHFARVLNHNLAENHEGWKKDLSVEERRAFLSRLNFIDTQETLSLEDIPDLSEPQIARVDTHGNLKLSMTLSEAPREWFGGPVNVRINGRTFPAQIRPNMFDNDTNLAGIAPGSSGDWKDSRKTKPDFLKEGKGKLVETWRRVPDTAGRKFLEIAFMGRSAKDELGLTNEEIRNGVNVFIEPVPTPAVARPAAEDRPVFAAAGGGS